MSIPKVCRMLTSFVGASVSRASEAEASVTDMGGSLSYWYARKIGGQADTLQRSIARARGLALHAPTLEYGLSISALNTHLSRK